MPSRAGLTALPVTKQNSFDLCERMIRKYLNTLLVCVAVIGFITSCADELLHENEPPMLTDQLSFGVRLPEDWNEMVKSKGNVSPSYVTNPVAFDQTVDGDTLIIYAIVEDILSKRDTVSLDSIPKTKADIPDKYDLGVYAYVMNKTSDPYTGANSGLDLFMNNTHVDVSDNYSYSPQKYWPGPDYSLKFFAYSPHIDNVHPTVGQAAYDVSQEDNFLTIKNYKVPTDVSKQFDITWSNPALLPGDNKQTIVFTMNHILSAVKVKVGNIAEGKVTQLKFSNIQDQGSRRINEKDWNLEVSKTDFSQLDEDGFVASAENQIGDTFYLLPQAFAEDSEICIDINVDGRSYPLSKSIKAILGDKASWQEGKQYTFVISTPEEVKVEIDDEVVYEGNYPVKQNLSIKNMGLGDIYIRVALTGSWLVDKIIGGKEVQATVDSWDKEIDGIFDWGAEKPQIGSANSLGWQLGSDGYYYYVGTLKSEYPKGIVKPGDELPKLFEKYTLTSSGSMPDSYLELAVVAQGVLFSEDLKDVFPDDILSVLGKNN